MDKNSYKVNVIVSRESIHKRELDENLQGKLLGSFKEGGFNPVFLVLSLISENWNL